MHKHACPKIFASLFIILSALVLAKPATADTINVMWDPNSEPDIAGYNVYVRTQPGTYAPGIDVGLTTSWLHTSAVAGQQYCYAVSAYLNGLIEGPRSIEVCGFSNTPPSLVNPGAQSSIVGQADSLQLVGNDPNGDPLTYTATGLPAGLTLMSSTGYISGTPTTPSTYTVTATTSDGVLTASQTFTWTVTVADSTAPVVTITGPTSAATHSTTGATMTLSGTASDNVGVTQVSWVNNRGGSGTASGTTSWSVSALTLQAGSNVLTVTARDAAGNTASDVLTVAYNAPPTLASVANQSSVTGLSTTLQLTGSDPNGDTLAYSATGLPTGLSVAASSGLISGTPTVVGTYNVTASVSDGALSASRTFTWTVVAPDTTLPAVSISSPAAAATVSGTATVTANATDNVGVTSVQFQIDGQNVGVADTTAPYTLTWNTTGIANGSHTLTASARDAAGNSRLSSGVVVTVSNTIANRTFGYTTVGGSVDTNMGNYANAWRFVMANETGSAVSVSVFIASPVSAAPNNQFQVALYSDVSGAPGSLIASSASQTIVPDSWNTAPISATVEPNKAYWLAYNTNGTSVTANGVRVDPGSANQSRWRSQAFGSWPATFGTPAGSAAVQASIYVSYSVAVADVTAPVVAITGPTSAASYATSTSTITLSGTASDNVGVTQVSWSNNRGGSGTATGTTNWSAAGVALQSGVNVLTVTARDAAGNTKTATLTVTFNVAPTLGAVANQTSAQSAAASLQLSGADADGDMLTYGGNGLPPGLALAVSTGLISGTPTTAGTYAVTVNVSDGSATATQTFTWTVTPETVAPTVAITSPTTAATFTTTSATMTLGGTASDNIGVTQVSWANSRGGSGVATGTTTWSAPITLQSGSNVLAVTASDAAGNTSTGTLTVTYNVGDTTVPVVTISNPTTAATLTTTSASVTFSGTAGDNVGVTTVTWSNDRGGSGTATGTTSWSVTGGVALQPGVNLLTVTARDAAGNTASDVVTVTYMEPLRVTSLTANRTAPQPLGTTVTFTAVAAGGTGPYTYKWRIYNGSKWVTKVNWSSNNQFVWTPTTARSGYIVRVIVRDATATTAMADMDFPIVP